MKICLFANHSKLSTLKYAILSHTWGDGEVSFQDFHRHGRELKEGFKKIRGCCNQARKDKIDWVWIDTCCIDKTDISELSEAINSMYNWYQSSAACYVLLEDVRPRQWAFPQEFDDARWFKRGWTLQELIAPKHLYFFANDWSRLGSKWGLQQRIGAITGIPSEVLLDGKMKQCCVAQRMSWAARRDTSRVEDGAYCLMGLFGVNMPLIYGEGRKAFQRLQQEILRQEEDFSFLLWIDEEHDVEHATVPVLALSARKFHTGARWHAQLEKVKRLPLSAFGESSKSKTWKEAEQAWIDRQPVRITPRGLGVHMWVKMSTPESWLLWTEYEDQDYLACIAIKKAPTGHEVYDRCAPWEICWIEKEELENFQLTELYLATDMARIGSARWQPVEMPHNRHADLSISLSWSGERALHYIRSDPVLMFEVPGADAGKLGSSVSPGIRSLYCPNVSLCNETFMTSYSRHDAVILLLKVSDDRSTRTDDSCFEARLWLDFSRPRCTLAEWPHSAYQPGILASNETSRLPNHMGYSNASDCAEVTLCGGEVMVTVEIKHRGSRPQGDFVVEIVAYEKSQGV